MNVDDVYNKIRLRNLKRAKLKQRQAELKLYIDKGDTELIDETKQDINNLEKEIKMLF